jgi:N-acetylglucosamine malate deacetylase 1
MLECHRSQLKRGSDADFVALKELMTRQVQARGAQAGVAAAEAFRPHNAFKRSRAW